MLRDRQRNSFGFPGMQPLLSVSISDFYNIPVCSSQIHQHPLPYKKGIDFNKYSQAKRKMHNYFIITNISFPQHMETQRWRISKASASIKSIRILSASLSGTNPCFRPKYLRMANVCDSLTSSSIQYGICIIKNEVVSYRAISNQYPTIIIQYLQRITYYKIYM